jgi:hypothetical protein
MNYSERRIKELRPAGLRQAFVERGFVAAVEWIAGDGMPLERSLQCDLLEQLHAKVKYAKRKRVRSKIEKLKALSADRGATEHERAAALRMIAKLRTRATTGLGGGVV